MNFLLAPHNFRNGDQVIVKLRYGTDTYEGTIHSIVNLPMNKYDRNITYVDYFYISFPPEVYDKVLIRELQVIHNNKPEVIGNITHDSTGKIIQLRLQHGPFSSESETNINNIQAALIWRRAYEILPKT